MIKIKTNYEYLFAVMVYQRCTKGVLLFRFVRAILIIAGKAYESGADLQALFLWPDASLILSRVRTYERRRRLCRKDHKNRVSIRDAHD